MSVLLSSQLCIGYRAGGKMTQQTNMILYPDSWPATAVI